MFFESSITFFLAIFVFAITPGPGTFALIARALTSGSMPCLFMAIGMTISDVIYLLLAFLGLAVIAEVWGEFFLVVRIVGSIYLLYLGYQMWTASVGAEDGKIDGVKVSKWYHSLLQGFLISASNPKVILFYIAFLPTIIDLHSLDSDDIWIVTLLTILGLMAGLMLVSVGAARAQNLFSSRRARKRLNRIAGSIMAGAGFYLAGHG